MPRMGVLATKEGRVVIASEGAELNANESEGGLLTATEWVLATKSRRGC